MVVAVGTPLDPQPAWNRSGVDPEHPHLGARSAALFSAYYEAPRPPVKNRRGAVVEPGRPAAVRFCGPLGGAHRVVDADILRLEAARLLDVAATLDALQDATVDVLDAGTLFE